VTFIDTANLYGRGHNERLIGHFLAGLDKSTREQFKIATKCGIDRSPDESYARTINNTPDYIIRCCNESLKRLGVERIDLFSSQSEQRNTGRRKHGLPERAR
jgi:aryl-alcohol dehydrogenase-like predicted oxidoreductase